MMRNERNDVLSEVDTAPAAEAAVVPSPEESRRLLNALDGPFQAHAKLKKAMGWKRLIGC